MKKISNWSLFILIVIVCISCSKELNNSIDTPSVQSSNDKIGTNDRLVFQNYDEYISMYKMLCKYSTDDELSFWAQTKKHTTLLNSQDTLLDKYSSVLRTILNEDYEFEIGESIVWFNVKTGDLLTYPKNLDKPDKENLTGLTKIGSIKLSKIGLKMLKATDVGAGTVHSKWQEEFTITRYAPCGGPVEEPISGMRKWVAELYHEVHYYSPTQLYDSWLWLRLKLEERTPRINWRQCYNYRELEYDIDFTAIYTANGYTVNTFSGSRFASLIGCDAISGPKNVQLADVATRSPVAPIFTVSMTGYIWQHILGDNTPAVTFPRPTDPPNILW